MARTKLSSIQIADEAWTSWTPNLGANFNVGSTGTVEAKYKKIGKTVIFKIQVILGGTGINMADPQFTLPTGLPAVASGYGITPPVGLAKLEDVTGAWWIGATTMNTTIIWPNAVNVAGTNPQWDGVNATKPFTWATGDRMFLQGVYETSA